ncbi:unannotated protein [freshwater metagenome]|uniref:Unannotated protein n=1 Tax=freshwater metagenome TaxID=449393 RepID=A0A6J6AP10_9ZZZZ
MGRDVAVALFVIGRLDDAGPRVVRDAMAWEVAVGASHSVATDCHEDDLRIDRFEIVVAEAATSECTWTHGLDDDVGVGGEFFERLNALFGSKIQNNGSFPTVAMEKEQRGVFDDGPGHLAAVIATRCFDLYDIGAEFGEIGGDGGGSEHRSFDNPDPGKGCNFSHGTNLPRHPTLRRPGIGR